MVIYLSPFVQTIHTSLHMWMYIKYLFVHCIPLFLPVVNLVGGHHSEEKAADVVVSKYVRVTVGVVERT